MRPKFRMKRTFAKQNIEKQIFFKEGKSKNKKFLNYFLTFI